MTALVIYKNMSSNCVDYLQNLLSKIAVQGKTPEEWSKIQLVMLHKNEKLQKHYHGEFNNKNIYLYNATKPNRRV